VAEFSATLAVCIININNNNKKNSGYQHYSKAVVKGQSDSHRETRQGPRNSSELPSHFFAKCLSQAVQKWLKRLRCCLDLLFVGWLMWIQGTIC